MLRATAKPALALFLLLMYVVPSSAQAHVITKQYCVKQGEAKGSVLVFRRCMRWRARHAAQHPCSPNASPTAAIRCVFGPYSGQAIRVAQCESGLRTTAANGQFWGLFQMGSAERARYGHGSTPIQQARAAYRYFVASGRDWSPWECKP